MLELLRNNITYQYKICFSLFNCFGVNLLIHIDSDLYGVQIFHGRNKQGIPNFVGSQLAENDE